MPEFLSSPKNVKVEKNLKKPENLSDSADGNTPTDESNEKTPETDAPNTDENPAIPPEMLNIPPPPLPPDNAGNQGIPAEASSAPTLSRWIQNKETRKAEILWALKCVLSHYSFNSNEDISALFGQMFWDSNIAKNYSCSRSKLAYLITFGIAPYFNEMLLNSVKQSSCYMVIFDESFNDLLQLDQMDVFVRFWKADKVLTRYIGSQFLDSGKAEDLLQALNKSLSGLDPS